MNATESEALGIDGARLSKVMRAVQADLDADRYHGAVLLVARRGRVILHEAAGDAVRSSGRAARTDDVFHLFSITKTFTAALVLRAVERGELMLTTPVAEVIPEFGAKGKQRVTVAQLLTHTAGLPTELPMMAPQHLGDTEAVALAVAGQAPQSTPGGIVCYSPIGAFAVLAEIVRRVDGGTRSFRDIMADELFAPLGMKSSSLCRRADLAERLVPVVVHDRTPGIIPPEALESINVMHSETFEMPGASALGTAEDLFRFAEALRRGGELDGSRFLSPAMLKLALTSHTGDEINHIFDAMCESRGWAPFPAHLGLGFFLRGTGIFPMPFGATASPDTFGGLGAGSTMFWVDPQRELCFVCLTTGVLEDSRNFERMHRLSDMVLASVID
jgi:CubicO group peptidase (beta-lactamase class C family)